MAQEKIQLPRQTGSYHVGVSNHFMQDDSCMSTSNQGRPLLVRMYYPIAVIPNEYPPYLSDTMHLYKEKIVNTYNVSLEEIAYLDEIKDWAVSDAPIIEDNSLFPVLFFSPGFFMAAQLYSSLIEEMASHGYVVIAINHTDACWPVKFPDGTVPEIKPELEKIFENKERSCIQTFDMTQEVWVQDVEVVLQWLRNKALKNIDLSRIGIFGHSFGGSTAIEAARQNKNFKAVASLDAMLFGENWDKPFETPSLFVVAEKQLTHEDAIKTGLTLEQCDSLLARRSKKVFEQMKDNSFYITVKNADHASFVDSKIIKSPLRKPRGNPLRCLEITRTLLVDFFDHYLRSSEYTILKNHALNNDIDVESKG